MEDTVRVLMDAYWLHDGPPSGKMVLHELIGAWIRAFPEDELVLAVPDRPPGEAFFKDLERVRTRARMHPLINCFELPVLAKSVRADCTFTQNFPALRPLSYAFIHDVLFQSNPEWFTFVERTYLSLIPMTIPRATRVFTSSKTEARRIQRCNPTVKSVCPTGLGIPSGFVAGSKPVALPQFDGFFLCVGRLNVRKNLTNALRGLIRTGLLSRSRPVLIIGESSGRSEIFPPDIASAIELGHVQLMGRVDDRELSWLYQHCQAFLCMSLDEGYGLPPVEARSLGAPVVVSDIDVFHETLDGFAFYADPRDPESIAERVLAAARHPAPQQSGFCPPSWSDVVGRIRSAIHADVYQS